MIKIKLKKQQTNKQKSEIHVSYLKIKVKKRIIKKRNNNHKKRKRREKSGSSVLYLSQTKPCMI
jgi:hypothetical protein